MSLKNDVLFLQDVKFGIAPKPVKYLFAGYSLGKKAVDDSIIPGSFNYCLGGETYFHTYYKIKYLLEKDDHCFDKLILPCGFYAFTRLDKGFETNVYYWGKYVDYLELGMKKCEILKYCFIMVKNRIFPYSQVISHTIDGLVSTTAENSFAILDTREKSKNVQMFFTQEKNPGKLKLNRKISIEYLIKTIYLCEHHGKEIIFINYPITLSHHLGTISYVGEKEYNSVAGDSIIIKSGKHLLWDLREIYFYRDDYFYDSRHMNKAGRTAFSLMLKDKLDALERDKKKY